MKKLVLLSSLFLSLFGYAPTSLFAIGPSLEETVGNDALEKINLNWKPILGDWTIQFKPGKPGELGVTIPKIKGIDILIRPKQSPEKVASTIAHELGHAFAEKYLTTNLRKEWLATRNLPETTSWYQPCGHCSDYLSGSGDFAESFCWTIQGPKAGFRSRLGPPPNEAQQNLIRKWLAELPKKAVE